MATASSGPAELVLTGGRIWTGEPAAPWAEALAVGGGRLLAVGTDAEALALAGEGTERRALDGAFLMPGLVDVHNHHALAGRTDLFELSFSSSGSVEEVLTAVREYAAELPADAWVTGGAWGSNLRTAISNDETRARLDEAAGGRPVMLMEDSRHNRWANTRALELAGITADSDPGEGGVIELDPVSGRPTGVLLESAGLPVEEAMARTRRLSAEQHRAASKRGVELLNSYGVTAFQDAAVSLEILEALRALDADAELDAWVVSSLTVNDQIFGYDPVGEGLVWQGEAFRTEHHRPDFVKIFLDGVPPARTGAFLEPYLPDDAHGDHFLGETTLAPEELWDWLRRTAERGLSAKIHCSGDAAVRLVLDTVERLRAEGFTEPRYQIAHGQFVADADIPRFADLGVSADMSPFIWFPGVIPEAIATVLPEERAGRMQPNRALLDAGALIAGGSDWPVSESPNAWEGIHGLVTRADPAGVFPGTLWPEQAITLDEAMAAFTINAAEAMGLGGETGSLVAGKSADFVVLDRDPFARPAQELVRTTVTETWFAGRRVYVR
ncbi:amidohydrolase [Agromyces mediolanus]|uniref:amidohydrolase n=1 Tax=Agromyces mediolanus TaxID=41986 RepID=UPI001E541AB1|nr:amidohydrolase [Agromyces mediolanus]MCD1571995.1 amidohydrolase [Agromyces mediolanus]